MSTTLYETDFFAWTQRQAEHLRLEEFEKIDWNNLLKEVEDMGRSTQRELSNRLIVLLSHLLKWHFQPENRGTSWRATVNVQRKDIARLLRKNPSLNAQVGEFIAEVYESAVQIAWGQTGVDYIIFPVACPYTVDQVLDESFWPE